MRHICLKLRLDRLGHALLQPEHIRRAVLAEQGAVHVARGKNFQPKSLLRRLDSGDLPEIFRKRRDLRTVRVPKAPAERRCHADAAVVRRAAAEPEQDAFCSAVLRVAQQLAHAVRRGVQGIESAAHQRQTRCRRHLERGAAVGQKRVGSLDRTAVRSRHAACCPLTAEHGKAGVHHAFPAVRHRQLRDVRVGEYVADRARLDLADLAGRKRSLERVRRQQNIHRFPLPRCVSFSFLVLYHK